MKPLIAGLAAMALSCLVAFGVAELAVRHFAPQMSGEIVFGYDRNLGAIPLPHQRGEKNPPQGPGYTFSHNSMGFRGDREYPRQQADFRVLFLGDSFTYGVGVNDDQTFPYLVEKLLRARGVSVETINAGNPGKGTDYALRLMQVWGEGLKPDLVVLGFFWNDFYDNADGEYFHPGARGELIPVQPHGLTAKKAWIENLPVLHWLLSWSQAANLVKVAAIDFLRWLPRTVQKMKNGLQTAPAVSRKTPGAPDESKYLPENPPGYKQLTRVYLGQLIKTVRSQGSDILLLYLPDAGQVEQYRQTGQISPYERDFLEVAASLGEEPHSLTPCLTAVQERLDLPYWGHWSAATNRVAAQCVSARVEALLQARRASWPADK